MKQNKRNYTNIKCTMSTVHYRTYLIQDEMGDNTRQVYNEWGLHEQDEVINMVHRHMVHIV